MSRIYDVETLKKHYEVEIMVLKSNIESMKGIIPIIEGFDGKIFNVKIERLIDEAEKNLPSYVYTNFKRDLYNQVEGLEMTFTAKERYIQIAEYNSISASHYDKIYVQLPMAEDKRINSMWWIRCIDKAIEEKTKVLETFERNSRDEIISEIFKADIEVRQTIDSFNDRLDSISRGMFAYNPYHTGY